MTNGDAMRIELTIKTDYMPSWGLWEGVRELVQNAKDGETQLRAKMTVEHDPATSTLTITNDGATLPHDALLLGHTTKLGDKNAIGQFGEGLKIGLLAIARAGHAVTIRNGGELWTPVMVKSPAFGCEVLAVDVTPTKGDRAARLSVTVGGVDAATWADYRVRFLFLAKPNKDEAVRTSTGSLLTGERFRGRLYVKGIFVQHDPELRMGYDFDDASVDRDRRMIDAWDRNRKQAWIWTRALAKQPSLTVTFGDMLADETKDVEAIADLATYVPDAVVAKLAGAFVRQHGKKAIPVANIAEAADIEHLGRRGVVLPKGLMTIIGGKVGSFKTVQADLANEIKRKLSWSELTPAMRGNLARAIDLVQLTGETIPLDLVDVVEFRSETIDGMFSPGKGGRISLAARVVADAGECLATMIHEVAHRRGGDGDKGHVAAIEAMWASIAVKLMERVEAAEAAAAGATTTAEEAEDRAERRAVAAPAGAPAGRSEWGKVGTAAEAFRRIIMTNAAADGGEALTDAQIFAKVLGELGPDRAGRPEHVGWYRCQLRKQGKAAPAAVIK